jgi:hypothetical protein
VKLCGRGTILRRRSVRTSIAVEISVVQDVIGVPLRGEPELRVDLDVVRAAGLMLDGPSARQLRRLPRQATSKGDNARRLQERLSTLSPTCGGGQIRPAPW